MTKRMLIDATHAEETRVVVLDGNRLEDFDVETSTKKQLKGNIYLAKIVRVEPSLQAAFVEYGGGRHGFLAFGEIHPDYYQIPVADRQRLLELQAEEAREEEEAEEAAARAEAHGGGRGGNGRSHGRAGPDHRAAGRAHDDDRQADFEAIESAPEREVGASDADTGMLDTTRLDVEPHGAAAASGHVTDVVDPHDGAPDAHPSDHDDAPADASPAEAGAAPHDVASGDDAITHRPAQPASIAQDVRFGDVEMLDEGRPVHLPGGGAVDDPPIDHGLDVYHDDPAEGEAFDGSTEISGQSDVAEIEAREIETREIEGDFDSSDLDTPPDDQPPPETIGGENDTDDGAAEARQRRISRALRNYRIQEVIRRRQIMLVQVVKEERGTKGAALTTYISLAGRFCVLMPNSPRGGGISRKITSAADRRRLKEITSELEIPKGMGLIVRTAGANRPKPEIKRDCEYLMRLWDDIRDHTMRSVAPALIYEEASLIKRAIRDVYSRDVEDVLVDGEQGWRAAHEFMRMLMPSHARKVQLWRDVTGQPLYSKYQVEAQLDAMMSPTVQLRSGGYLVLAQTEAMVTIDVNSGRSTRERGIEETAVKTNLEAADEIARQLRLRDLAGLVVIDFIDMESRKHNAMVERRMKEALKNDRARIQVGHISHFGLLEMSRQRLRPSLAETTFVTCPHCGGAGHVRSVESSAIHVLREIEDEGGKQRASLIMVYCAGAVVLYLLNNKRDRLAEIETRSAMKVHFTPDDSLIGPQVRIDRLKPPIPESERPRALPVIPAPPTYASDEEVDDIEDEADEDEAPMLAAAPSASPSPGAPAIAPAMSAEETEKRRRRRRRRRGGRRDEVNAGVPGAAEEGEREGDDAEAAAEAGEGEIAFAPGSADDVGAEASQVAAGPATAPVEGQPLLDPTEFDENGLPRARGPRRSRRGGRRRRRDGGPEVPEAAEDVVEAAPLPVYVGPTPADPFGGHVYDIFDMMDPELAPAPPPPPRPAPLEPRPASTHVTTSETPAPVSATAASDAIASTGYEPPPVEPAHVEPEPVVAAKPEPVTASAPEPNTPSEQAVAEHPVPEPVAPVHAEPHDPTANGAMPNEPQPAAPAESAPMPLELGTPIAALNGGSHPEAAPEAPPAEPEPAIKPIVIGKDMAPASEPKRGWWRR